MNYRYWTMAIMQPVHLDPKSKNLPELALELQLKLVQEKMDPVELELQQVPEVDPVELELELQLEVPAPQGDPMELELQPEQNLELDLGADL